MKITLTSAALILGIANSLLHARPVQIATPEQMFAMADVVANGKVQDFVITEKRAEITLGSNQPIKVRVAEAHINRIGISKGELPEQIILVFPVYDFDSGPVINGPILPDLVKGERYRLYLKRQGDRFVTILHEEFDSGLAVHRLAPEEPDGSPPLFKKEAAEIALREFRRFRPNPDISAITEHFSGGDWMFTFYTPPPLSLPPHTSDAEISVRGSRLISPRSYVGAEKPRVGSTLSKNDLNKPLRITVEGNFPDETTFFDHANEVTILYGVINRIEAGYVSGAFISPAFAERNDKKLLFPLSKVTSVQRLALKPETLK